MGQGAGLTADERLLVELRAVGLLTADEAPLPPGDPLAEDDEVCLALRSLQHEYLLQRRANNEAKEALLVRALPEVQREQRFLAQQREGRAQERRYSSARKKHLLLVYKHHAKLASAAREEAAAKAKREGAGVAVAAKGQEQKQKQEQEQEQEQERRQEEKKKGKERVSRAL